MALLEAHPNVVDKSDEANITLAVSLTPLVSPQVKHIMQVDVGRERRKTGPLRTAHLARHVLAVLQHTGFQPFLDESHHAPVRDPMHNKPHQPVVNHGVVKSTNVDIDHLALFTSYDHHRMVIQSIM